MLSQKISIVVTPAKAGVQKFLNFLDSRFHGNDRKKRFRTFYELINTELNATKEQRTAITSNPLCVTRRN